ncbi:hypothetical protein SAMN05216526_1642 [Ectothiorhodosinus mongolicus]|uniref:Uncharacterized protein n=1 Tax=Ectothiorhodosinus mongolicus TaxID=233100 RepID=A0A1R3W3W3_9GAMM|nr:hypothetical protein [Ectothiorhodosinus mongolicus]ULX57479.1 hypothetical protein CKX93_07235 [Ectothiorhodosinus mongolicus]SIT72405.1 hypothetical protein SAMN05216526_1642 [Ectothiorhodosinus mongolicus]
MFFVGMQRRIVSVVSKRNGKVAALLLVLALGLQGCGATLQTRNANLDNQLATGDFVGAALAVEQSMGLASRDVNNLPPVEFKSRNVLDHLDAAKAWLLAGDDQRAMQHFEAAEIVLGDVDRDGNIARGAQQVGGALLGDGAMVYRPSPSEAVLINYYKAILFMRDGRHDDARVELNRADERTRRAVARYSRELDEARSEARQRGASEVNASSFAATHYPEMQTWQPYTDFVLPPATYLQALFLGLQGNASDTESARNLMQRVVDMTDNPSAHRDLQMLSQGNLCPENNCVWVISEHGLGPTLVEKRVDLPVPTSNGFVVVSIALPSLVTRTNDATPYFRLVSGQNEFSLEPLASMDRTVQTEFTKRFPAMVARATAGAVARAVVQDEIGRRHGALAGFVASVASMATTNADVRMWRSMPGGFSAARYSYQPGSTITIRSVSGDQTVTLNGTGPQIIYIKQVGPTAAPIVTQLLGA